MAEGAIIAFKINHIVHNEIDILITVRLTRVGGIEPGVTLIYAPKPENGSRYIVEIINKLTTNQTQFLFVYLFIIAHWININIKASEQPLPTSLIISNRKMKKAAPKVIAYQMIRSIFP